MISTQVIRTVFWNCPIFCWNKLNVKQTFHITCECICNCIELNQAYTIQLNWCVFSERGNKKESFSNYNYYDALFKLSVKFSLL